MRDMGNRFVLMFNLTFKWGFIVLTFFSCGTNVPQNGLNSRCFPNVKSKDYSTCCAGHGGPSTECGLQQYQFNSSDEMICADASVSSCSP